VVLREVIAQSIDPGGVVRWPTRLAVARLDLGLVAAQRGQPDEAAQLEMAALRSGRVVGSTLGWFADLDTMLRNHMPGSGGGLKGDLVVFTR
jgi:hypothetical protein